MVEALADTGCQTCLAGMDFLSAINCPPEYLIATSHKIVGISNSNVNIIAALFVKIELEGRVTRQMVYISSQISGLFLSEESLKGLEVISKYFPQLPETLAATTCQDSMEDGGCSCPKYANTPDRPAKIPFEPTKANKGKLEKWLRDAFAASSFNQCTHQEMRKLTGAPMEVRIKKGSVPYAVNSPIPVAHHWKAQVKADLERDVRMGIIEPVPQRMLTTWCARMVVAAKPDGSHVERLTCKS